MGILAVTQTDTANPHDTAHASITPQPGNQLSPDPRASQRTRHNQQRHARAEKGYIGQTSITTLGIITTGEWEATPIARAYLPDASWTLRATPGSANWLAACYGAGVFVAVGTGGGTNDAMVSPDGIEWTLGTTPSGIEWTGVTFGNGLFVAVGQLGTGNNVMTSPDGLTWTSRTSAADNQWQGVAFGNNTFVAVSRDGSGNNVMTSPDGINWTLRSSPDQRWNAVTYGNGLFVAVAASGTGNRVMTSPNGVTWTSRTSAADQGWAAIVYGGGQFVAVCGGQSANAAMTSPDGITWTAQTGASSNFWDGVAYGNGVYIATGQSLTNASNVVMASLDGITWVSLFANGLATWSAVAFGNETFVSVGQGIAGYGAMTSQVANSDLAISETFSTWPGSTSITTVGTITAGTWNATPITVPYGGTGLAALTAHAVLLGEGTSNVAFATTGTAGRVLIDKGASSDPAFTAISGSGATFSLSSGGVLTISAIANASLSNSSVTVTAGTGLTGGGTVALGASVTISANTLDTIPAPVASVSLNSQKITSLLDPTLPQDAATKNYVDNQLSLVTGKQECQAATVAGLAAYTYNNGSSGVGATITLTVAAILVLDGYTPALNDRILVKNETAGNAPNNGIYTLTRVGTALITAILTRTTDFDQPADGIDGAYTFIQNGTVNKGTGWLCSAFGSITFGTTNINWTQYAGPGITAGGDLSGTYPNPTTPGSVNIVTVGTVTAGTWNAGAVTSSGMVLFTPNSGTSGSVRATGTIDKTTGGSTFNTMSTVADTTVYTVTVKANSLGATGGVRVTIGGDMLMNSGATTTMVFRVNFGATTLWASITGSYSAASTLFPWWMTFVIGNANATNAQVVIGEIALGSRNAATTGEGNLANPPSFFTPFYGTAAEDTTGDKALAVVVRPNVSNAAVQITVKWACTEILP